MRQALQGLDGRAGARAHPLGRASVRVSALRQGLQDERVSLAPREPQQDLRRRPRRARPADTPATARAATEAGAAATTAAEAAVGGVRVVREDRGVREGGPTEGPVGQGGGAGAAPPTAAAGRRAGDDVAAGAAVGQAGRLPDREEGAGDDRAAAGVRLPADGDDDDGTRAGHEADGAGADADEAVAVLVRALREAVLDGDGLRAPPAEA